MRDRFLQRYRGRHCTNQSSIRRSYLYILLLEKHQLLLGLKQQNLRSLSMITLLQKLQDGHLSKRYWVRIVRDNSIVYTSSNLVSSSTTSALKKWASATLSRLEGATRSWIQLTPRRHWTSTRDSLI